MSSNVEAERDAVRRDRDTYETVKSKIKEVAYLSHGNKVTVCIITMENSGMAVAHSICALPAHFNKDIGEQRAYAKALDKAVELEAYLLQQRIFNGVIN